MANIQITIPDAVINRVLDAFAARFNYDTAKLENETKGQFAKRMVGVMVKEIVIEEEQKKAANTAYDAARAAATTDISIT